MFRRAAQSPPEPQDENLTEYERARKNWATAEAAQLRGHIERRLSALEADHVELSDAVAGIGKGCAEAIDTLVDQRIELSREQREEIRELKIEVAKLSSLVSELREKTAPFRFAREKEAEPLDVPPNRELN
jgi:hypothetical protein